MADKELELIVKFTGKLSDELDQALNKLRSTIQNTVKTGTEPLTNSVDKLSQTMKKSADSIKEVTVGAGRLKMIFGDLGERIAGMVKAQALFYAVQKSLFAVMGQISDGISSYYELEKKITDMAAITGANAEEQKKMSTAAREAGNTTTVSAEEAADAMMLLRQAGYDTTQTIQTLKAVTMAMTTTNESAALTTDLLTTALAAWNIPASRAEEVMSDLIKGADLSKLKMSDLKTSFNLAAGTMSSFNFSIKDTLVTLGVLRDRGSAAGTSARALRQALNTLGLAATDVNNAFGKFLRGKGVSLDLLDVTKSTFNLANAMDELKAKGIGSADIMKYFSANAREVMLKLIDAGDVLREYGNRFDKLPSLQERFDVAMGSTINQLKLLRNNFSDLIKIFVTNLNPTVQNTTKFLLQLVDALKVMAGEATDENIDKIKRMGLSWIAFTEVLVSTYGVIQTFFTGLYAGFTTIYAAIQLLFGEIYKDIKRTQIEELGKELDRLSAAGKDTTEVTKKMREAQAALDAAIIVSGQIAGDYVKDMEGYNEKLQKIGQKTIETFEKLQRPVTELERLIAKTIEKTKKRTGIIKIKIEVDDEESKKMQADKATLENEIKQLEIRENYGEKWIEKKGELYGLELVMNNLFVKDSEELNRKVYEYKEKLRGEDSIQAKKKLDEDISREHAVSQAKMTIAEKDRYRQAKDIDFDISETKRAADEKFKVENEHLLKRAELANIERSNREKKAQLEIDAATNFFDRLIALMAKDDLKKPFEVWADFAKSQVDRIADGIGDAFANVIVEGKNLQDELENVWKNIAKSLVRELTNQAIKGIILAFFKGIRDAAKSDSGGESSWWWGLIKAVVGGISAYFGGGSPGGSGTYQGPGPGGSIHSGGYVGDVIKSFHSGGLNANETVAKLRTDEYVMGPLATKKIGVDNLNEMNRSGSVSQEQQQQQPQPIQIINVTDPNDIPRYLTENPNIVLNIIARDKRYSGQMKEIMANR